MPKIQQNKAGKPMVGRNLKLTSNKLKNKPCSFSNILKTMCYDCLKYFRIIVSSVVIFDCLTCKWRRTAAGRRESFPEIYWTQTCRCIHHTSTQHIKRAVALFIIWRVKANLYLIDFDEFTFRNQGILLQPSISDMYQYMNWSEWNRILGF